MAENNSSAPLKTAEGSYPALPEPDTHCHDEDTGRDVWSYSAEQMRAYAAQAVAAQAAPAAMAVTEAQIDAILDEPGGMIFYVSDQRQKQHLFARRVLALATPALPATEHSSAGDLAEASHQTKLLAQALGDCILASGIVRSDLEMSGPQLLMFAEDLKEQLLARQAVVQAEPVADYPHEQMDALALARYKVVQSDQSMYWRNAVVAGDGQQHLYNGSEVDCQNMARKFAGAFLDGAFAFHQRYTAPQAQPADALLLHALELAYDHIEMDSLRISHCKDAAVIDAAMAAAQEGGNASAGKAGAA